jgi:hypothetical protein
MGENRQISHAEKFQLIDVDILPLQKGILTFFSLEVNYEKRLQRVHYRKKREKKKKE